MGDESQYYSYNAPSPPSVALLRDVERQAAEAGDDMLKKLAGTSSGGSSSLTRSRSNDTVTRYSLRTSLAGYHTHDSMFKEDPREVREGF